MDASAYLTSQGWLGKGHALHHSGRGITTPILASQKKNVLGIGKKQHDAHADQWWARAFDNTLKGINTTKNDAGNVEGIALGNGATALQTVGKGLGKGTLYSNFVQGESLKGTLTPENDAQEMHIPERKETKSKAGEDILTGSSSSSYSAKKKSHHIQGADDKAPDLNVTPADAQRGHSTSKDSSEAKLAKEQRRQFRREKRAKKALRQARREQRLSGSHNDNRSKHSADDVLPELQEEPTSRSTTEPETSQPRDREAQSDTASKAINKKERAKDKQRKKYSKDPI